MGPFEREYKALYPAITTDKWFEPTEYELSAGREFFFEQLLKIHRNMEGTKSEDTPVSNENIVFHVLMPFGVILFIYLMIAFFS
jgi:hypothetical protein